MGMALKSRPIIIFTPFCCVKPSGILVQLNRQVKIVMENGPRHSGNLIGRSIFYRFVYFFWYFFIPGMSSFKKTNLNSNGLYFFFFFWLEGFFLSVLYKMRGELYKIK